VCINNKFIHFVVIFSVTDYRHHFVDLIMNFKELRVEVSETFFQVVTLLITKLAFKKYL